MPKRKRPPRFLVMDTRAIFEPDDALVLTCADTLKEAIQDCRDQGQGAVIEDGNLVFWRSADGDGKLAEWDARRPKEVTEVEDAE